MEFKTHITGGVLSCCLLIAAPMLAAGQKAAAPKPAVGTPVAPAQSYGKLLNLTEQEFVSAAEAMPEDKFDFAPPTTYGEYKGVRTFAEQLKHVTEANEYYFNQSNKPLADIRADIEKLKTRGDILKALKDSFAMAHAYVDAMKPENAFVALPSGNTRAYMVAYGIAHYMDHYGQLVEYLRMNGIVPPASRKGGM